MYIAKHWIGPIHKSHNAPVPYLTMHHFVTELCTFVHISVTKWCIVHECVIYMLTVYRRTEKREVTLSYAHRCHVTFAFVRGYGQIEIHNSLRWRHNGHDGVSNHQPHHCLLNSLFGWKKTSKLRITGLCAGNSPGTGEFPAQRASYAENVSIWWRHHV